MMRGTLAITMAAGLAAIVGCSGQKIAASVDADKARDALKTVLESWKQGGTIDALKNGSPSIVAQDFDWMNGAKLIDYQIEDPGKNDDANLRIPVKLTLQGPNGKEVQKQVRYIVGTDPAITVFRDMF